jgi:hypothetical protein
MYEIAGKKVKVLYAFFWVIPRRLDFICRRFGTLCLFNLHRQVGACRILHPTTCLSNKRKHTTFRTRRKFEIKVKVYNVPREKTDKNK